VNNLLDPLDLGLDFDEDMHAAVNYDQVLPGGVADGANGTQVDTQVMLDWIVDAVEGGGDSGGGGRGGSGSAGSGSINSGSGVGGSSESSSMPARTRQQAKQEQAKQEPFSLQWRRN
jgi:hypothetical protein